MFNHKQEVQIVNHEYYTGATATVVTTNVQTHMVRIVLHHNWTEIKQEVPMWIHESHLQTIN